MTQKQIGVVVRLRRYPIKSMRGEDLSEARVFSSGVEGDRRFAFVVDEYSNTMHPWMTARHANEMLLYEPNLSYDKESDDVDVLSPEGEKFSVSDGTLEKDLEQRFGRGLSLRHDRAGCFDSKPLSLIGVETIRDLSRETGLDLQLERFRANVYVDWDEKKPFYEDELIDKNLIVTRQGSIDSAEAVKLRLVKKDSRCVIPTLDPVTARPSPEVLEVIQASHGGCAGVYAVVEKEGTARVGDSIYVV